MKKFVNRNISNIYAVYVLLLTIIILASYASYAIFSIRKERKNSISITTGQMNYNLTSNDVIDSKMIIPGNSSKEIEIIITSLNPIESKYQLYYLENSNITIEYKIDNDDPFGSIGQNGTNKNVSIVISNKSNESQTIILGVQGGMIDKELILDSGKTAVNMTYAKTAKDKILASNPVQKTKESMFNYTNEGTQYGNNEINEEYITNGLYSAEDEDGTSYYYRGNVNNNNIQFGEYVDDYYLYRYSTMYYQSIATCNQCSANTLCTSRTEKYKLANAKDKMYWKIIRINGDGSLRLIYNGTSPDNKNNGNMMAGKMRYNGAASSPISVGYDSSIGTNCTGGSVMKRELDKWYENTLGKSSDSEKIITKNFCNDTSGYQPPSNYGFSYSYTRIYSSFDRLGQSAIKFTKDNQPSFVCPETTASYGGSFQSKIGLITFDELVFSGLQFNKTSKSHYLNDESDNFSWTMTPALTQKNTSNTKQEDYMWSFQNGSIAFSSVGSSLYIRPVINVMAEDGFVDGTDGTIENPYILK